jgi:very-short-patch-repair endonuclease
MGKWPTNSSQHEYMKMRQSQNATRCVSNTSENWMHNKLQRTPFKWTRQAQWGYRLFDFWCHQLGVAIEIDGASHNQSYDRARDRHNFQRSGILVFRVRNLNEEDAKRALEQIESAGSWNSRRAALGLKPIRLHTLCL